MGLSREEYWSGLPFPSPRDLPDPGIEQASPAWQVDSLPLIYLFYVISRHHGIAMAIGPYTEKLPVLFFKF